MSNETVRKTNNEYTRMVKVTLPPDPMNPMDREVHVGINGHFWTIKRSVKDQPSVAVELPADVYTLLQEAGYNPSVTI